MGNKKLWIRIVFCAAMLAAAAFADTQVWGSAQQIRLVLDDPLDHPFYSWPKTLLSYPIRFDAPVDLDRLVLTNSESQNVPVQWSGVVRDGARISQATLNFFSDLPAGGHREFILSAGKARQTTGVTESREHGTIVLDGKSLRVRIPGNQMVRGEAPGPILELSRGGQWFGTSSFHLSGDPITRIETERLDSGPLFITYQLTYRTARDVRYVATVRCFDGLDFIQLRENMENLDDIAEGMWKLAWNGLPVAYRQSSNHPYPFPARIEEYDHYHWEAIAQRQTNTHLGVLPGIDSEGRLPFSLGVYEPWWAFSTSTFANFWDTRNSDAVGAFIDRVADWQDHDYAIWHASSKLQIGFSYQSETLSFHYPVLRGSRSSCLTLYDHQKDIDTMHQLEQAVHGVTWHDGIKYSAHLSPTSYAVFLQNRYGTIDLNSIKDWVLGKSGEPYIPKKIFSEGIVKSASELERRVMSSDLVNELPITGTRQNGGFGPVSSRQIQDWWIDGFDRLDTELSAQQRRRLTAMYLFMAYVHAGEDYMPMIPMLAGHPNFLSDVKSTPPAMAFLFPWHPLAQTWADEFEKYAELNTRYHTRPDVAEWNARGGRWTENLGTYVWAFLRPSLRAEFLLKQYDGQERFVTPQIAQLGNWLVDSLSAPYDGEPPGPSLDAHDWGMLLPGDEPRRVYAPMGAHSAVRIPPRSLWYLGLCLERYAPLTAEHMLWAARPTDQDMETPRNAPDPWRAMYDRPDNRGTNPHLRTTKYTGYGITMRAAGGTKDELSIHLQQIDDGPNYRWGNAAEGGNGVLYFFAGGKSYSFNGREDVGDRDSQDTDFCTNFGVWKNGYFHSVGRNVLASPLYDLDIAQYAELLPRTGPGSYATPEYVSRSVLLAGHDYFVLYDDVFNESVVHRLSWFIRPGERFPFIKLAKGAGRGFQTQETEIKTSQSIGKWFDGLGDSMAVVSNRTDLDVAGTSFGAVIHGHGIDDLVFRDPDGVHYRERDIGFDGTAGLVRHHAGGTYELTLFHGRRIAVPGLILSTGDGNLGISATVQGGESIAGDYFAPVASSASFDAANLPENAALYIDGERQPVKRGGKALEANLKQGAHHWEITARMPMPGAPRILRIENAGSGARVVLEPVASASNYRLELSSDSGQVWEKVAESTDPAVDLRGLTIKTKVHVRAIALNAERESAPGPEYPIYVTDQPPSPPDGLRVELSNGSATLSWGEVLGAAEYRLYGRQGDRGGFTLLYHGLGRSFQDRRAFVKKSHAMPGRAPDPLIMQYKVTAANGNGEGPSSRVEDTDPSSWRNWAPQPGEPFRRENVKSRAAHSQANLYYPR